MAECRFYCISQKGKISALPSLSEAVESMKNNSFIWLDYYQPYREDLIALKEYFDIHSLAIEDCTDENFVPKIDEYPSNTFIIFNTFGYAKKTLTIDEVDFIISDKFLISVSGFNSNGRRPLNGIHQLVEREIENVKHGPAFLLHVIVDSIVDNKFIVVEALEDEIDSTEEKLLENPSDFNPSELVLLRRQLLTLRKSLFHEREILIKICRKDCPYISEKAIFHFRDIYDHLSKFFELTESYRDVVTSLMEMHMSMMNNLLTTSSNETNATVKRLTLISTIFLPLTLLASIGGMSEWTMMTERMSWKISYPIFLAGLLVIGVINYQLIKRFDKKN